MEDLENRLNRAGLSVGAAADKAALFRRAAEALGERGVSLAPGTAQAWFVPGRVEVLGKHTDYCGGRSLIMTVERGFCLIAAPRADRVVRLLDVLGGRVAEFPLDPGLTPTVGDWINYPMTVARRVARNFTGATLHGADIAFASDLPLAAGLSSSSALVVAIFLALARVNDLEQHENYRENIDSPEALAGYLGTIENGQSFGTLAGDRGVGTFGGSEDHTAILCGQPGRLSQYAYCPVRLERRISAPADWLFAVMGSGVVAEKTGSAMEKYNRVSRLAAALVRLWQQAGGKEATLAAILASSPEAPSKLSGLIGGRRNGDSAEFQDQELASRLNHFRSESEAFIPKAGDSLLAGDLQSFGRWVDCSQEDGSRLLDNQVPETIALARAARELGAAAASAFGAGFGGSVWALVAREGAEAFLAEWTRVYKKAFPERAGLAAGFLTPAGPAAFELAWSGD